MKDMIPVNSLARHIAPLQQQLSAAAARVVASGHYVLGPHVVEFERAFARYCGARECIGVANGTDALELGLRALGVEPGDGVAVAANAAMYGTTATQACGAQPVFVDVDATTGTLDPADLERVLADDDRIRVVIATHLYGRLADMAAIKRIAEARGVRVMEDCAQAHGAVRDGERAGAIGDAASFSFYPTKNLGALGDGGAVTTNDPAVADRVRRLRQYGWEGKYNNVDRGGRNSRLDEIQAAMLAELLPRLDEWNVRRRAIANRYSEGIKNPTIAVPPVAGDDYVAHLYVVQTETRDALRDHLAAAGIQSDVHYPTPDHRQPCHDGAFAEVRLPVTEHMARSVLTLPCFPELEDAEVDRVIESCNQF
ncbi:DegT/DnrJ/EryC1/StrS family aminotransferase [Lysobacter sp. TY2-98]|uniref:DegT/DnrJ/EryC1/StrS family aminotransferase n=1 Tax=Lysobacter sp. TY2-98 TaxID=2290922 RepID=UPI000E2050C6|nr:DegT/DnrJ/EryC1/StrS family aminotransferase [Lysobacter sp. TY2-98]AXK70897.1 DegT/DnrJ/EryC1/StrS family aminotransferase [Lysobacter sp. TY2-98]